ncbi:mercuric transport protein MerTP [Hymenobacter sp. BT186]|uniref:Mercuric transport protein MerT n=1 Tax=Hymenobacter telluris TaxID=2816474 RepID=A0A939EVC5_9BACT|nr:mercuric transport protein MerTP [Hymenobacter telluris]MBO0357902.1 mercuric transport protein MerTP [Hymenobacter telluris]MBW3373929.1 mercuric transport protein MerTP [Hymenobacter norwichensis]
MSTSPSSQKPLIGAGLLAALAASLCCITPLLAVLGGLSGVASTFAWLDPLRPYSVALTVVALGVAWYQQFKPAPAADACGCAVDAKPSLMQSKGFLGAVTVLAALLLGFPYYGARFYPTPAAPVVVAMDEAVPVWQTANFRIGGMTCDACAKHVEHAVQQVPGVQAVTVSYDQGTAQVRFNAAKSPAAQVAQAITGTGYTVLATN